MRRLIAATLVLLAFVAPVQATTVCFRTPGVVNWTWPTGVTVVKEVRLWGGGGSGGGSNCSSGIYGGAAASSAYVPSTPFNRPSSGVSQLTIGAGAAAVPSNSLQDGYEGARTSFRIDAYGDTNPNVFSTGGGGGQPGVCGAGGDGGAGGVYGGPDVGAEWILGGQGQASSTGGGFPVGAPAPRGGMGGNNNQDGMQPGGGGAPGNKEFASGKGGDGMACLDF